MLEDSEIWTKFYVPKPVSSFWYASLTLQILDLEP